MVAHTAINKDHKKTFIRHDTHENYTKKQTAKLLFSGEYKYNIEGLVIL